jgi:hypothetical protein
LAWSQQRSVELNIFLGSIFIIMEAMEDSDRKAKMVSVKVKVLEAMAKLEMKKEQEREESMKATSKQTLIATPSPKSMIVGIRLVV